MGVANKVHAHTILENELMLNLSSGVDETLRTMAQVSSIFEPSFSGINWVAPCEYSVYLDISSPPTVGQIRLHFSFNALVGLYKGMIGDTNPPDIKEVIDILGEISNVSYGLAKGKLNREGYSLGMSLPHPGKTSDLPLLESERPSMIIPFNVFNETCYIQLVIL